MPSSKLTTEKVDLLNRQESVDRMITVTEMLAANKKNACYALNGSWGVGKSFVLGMFEEQIMRIQTPETTMGKYLLFHFDCWKYDYYEEPLAAIVASMLDAIDAQVNLLLEEKREKLKGTLKVIGIKLIEKVNEIIEEKTGVNPQDIQDVYNGVNEEAAKRIADNHAFDPYFDFNKLLNKQRDTVASLSKDQTVIFVVDELDRCLPEYTIKVLERLHHVFDDIPNVQLILSIDKSQIQHIVQEIFGAETNVEKYLAKFRDFEIKLEEGTITDIFAERFHGYTQNFELIRKDISPNEVEEFITISFKGLDMRRQISIIERCQLIHNLISDNSVMDTSLMCMEVLMVLLYENGLDLEMAKQYFDISRPFYRHRIDQKSTFRTTSPGMLKLNEMYASGSNRSSSSWYYKRNTEDKVVYINASTLLGRIIGGFRYLIGYKDDYWQEKYNSWLVEYVEKPFWVEHITKFWSLLQIIN